MGAGHTGDPKLANKNRRRARVMIYAIADADADAAANGDANAKAEQHSVIEGGKKDGGGCWVRGGN